MKDFIIDFIVELLYWLIQCFWNGYLIKEMIKNFIGKKYFSFGVSATLIFINLIILAKHFWLRAVG